MMLVVVYSQVAFLFIRDFFVFFYKDVSNICMPCNLFTLLDQMLTFVYRVYVLTLAHIIQLAINRIMVYPFVCNIDFPHI